MSRGRRVAVVAVVTAVAAVIGQSGAFGDVGPVSDVATITGAGQIVPGITPVGCVWNNVIDAHGVVDVVGDDTLVGGIFGFHGESNACASVANDAGVGNVFGAAVGNVGYVRVGTSLVINGAVLIGGEPHILEAQLTVVPLNANPTTAFQFAGTAQLQS